VIRERVASAEIPYTVGLNIIKSKLVQYHKNSRKKVKDSAGNAQHYLLDEADRSESTASTELAQIEGEKEAANGE